MRHADKIQRHIDAASEMLAAGFTTKAAKKRAQEQVSCAWELLTEDVRAIYLDKGSAPRTEAETALYYDFPSRAGLFKQAWADRVKALFGVEYPVWWTLKDMSEAIKIADISPVPPKHEAHPVAERAYKSIEEQLKAAKADVVRGLNMAELFGHLPVSVTAHHCFMANGTSYLRCFWFVAGRMTKLGVILATLDALKKKQQ